MKMRRGSVATLLLVFLLLACEQQVTNNKYPLQYSDAIMGTSFTIKVSQLPSSVNTVELRKQIKQLLDKLNGQMSTYQKDSELSVINQNKTNEWLSVSAPLYQVLKEAQIIYELSSGAFDITVGPLVNLWGFGPDPISFKAPDNELIEQSLTKLGTQHILFNDKKSQLKKDINGLYIDLSAIAKGFAVDQVALFLEQQGISNYMVEIGGEVRLNGFNIKQKPWRIAIEKPTAGLHAIEKILPLTNISLATSGDYRNFFEVDGVRFSHTIDPRTGKPITHNLASVTILSDTAMRADALATAMMVLGAEQGYTLAEKQNIAALFIIKTDEGFVEKTSSAFINRLR